MYHFTALVTLLAVLVYFYSSILVSRARAASSASSRLRFPVMRISSACFARR